MKHLLSFEIVLAILQQNREKAVLDFNPIFSPVTSYIW